MQNFSLVARRKKSAY